MLHCPLLWKDGMEGRWEGVREREHGMEGGRTDGGWDVGMEGERSGSVFHSPWFHLQENAFLWDHC